MEEKILNGNVVTHYFNHYIYIHTHNTTLSEFPRKCAFFSSFFLFFNQMSESSVESPKPDTVLLFRGKHSLVVNQTEREEVRSTGEEAWTDEAESLAINWADKACDKSLLHLESSVKNSRLHIAFGLPAVILPVIFALTTPYAEEISSGKYIIMASYVLLATLNGINQFFNFDRRRIENENFSARFGELTSDVRYQLFKSRRFRVPSDEFLARLQTKLHSLIEQEPPT